ncbi:conserved hypothetical protein [Ricinus communis]|uniref:Uncharacterized protein n=1 Tax=Ricinus communis TaxID=3988 RepID=B9T879_RICCO|nr:conserved hypothetical protein [Ricinus communis]
MYPILANRTQIIPGSIPGLHPEALQPEYVTYEVQQDFLDRNLMAKFLMDIDPSKGTLDHQEEIQGRHQEVF